MNLRNMVFAVTSSFVLMMTGAAIGGDEIVPPNRFVQLLQVGEVVLMRPSSSQPVYTVQLLTREQAKEIEATHAKYEKLRSQRDGIETQLETEQDLNKRAKMYLEYESLAADVAKTSSTARLETYAYEVAHVGDDFVTLKKPGKQKYVPLRSIREMFRSELTGVRGNSTPRRKSSRPSRRMTQIRLRNTIASEIAGIVNKFYPDPKRELVVREDGNLLLLTTDEDSATQLKRFISILDAVTQPPADAP